MILNSEDKEDYVAIGELSRLTGIGTHTLRVWEKRYGVPESVRLPSNHRRYPKMEVNRLQAIAKALESGSKPSKVVNSTPRELDLFLYPKTFEEVELEETPAEIGLTLANWIEATILYDEQLLNQGLRYAWDTQNPINFISNYVAPFVKNIGIAWRSQELTISQEHFASELLGNFLSEKWKRLNENKRNTNVVLANIPGETHKLGLQMCAVVTAFSDNGIVFLGSDNSCKEVASTIEACEAKLLGISISSCFDTIRAENYLAQLRSQLSECVSIVVGGEGAPNTVSGVTKFSEFYDYYQWLGEISE